MKDLIRKILIELGENPDRDGLKETPRRVEQALHFMTRGYTQNADELLNNALFDVQDDVQYDEMVVVSNIDFSACANITCCLFSARFTSDTFRIKMLWASAKSPAWWKCSAAACRYRSG